MNAATGGFVTMALLAWFGSLFHRLFDGVVRWLEYVATIALVLAFLVFGAMRITAMWSGLIPAYESGWGVVAAFAGWCVLAFFGGVLAYTLQWAFRSIREG
jgi:hypothetical protein